MKIIVNKTDRLWKIPQSVLGSMRFTQKRLAARHVDLIDLESFIPEVPDNLEPLVNDIRFSGMMSDPQLPVKLSEKIASNHLSLKSLGLDPESEIVITPGIRATAIMLSLGLLNPGDAAAYPDPGMQYFRTSICLADGIPRKYALLESNDYIINISSLLAAPHKKLKLLYINYPHNPSGAAVDYYFYRELMKGLHSANILIAADCAYIYPGNPDLTGPLQVKNASSKVIELHSFATTLGLPGLGFAVGHKDVIAILKSLLSAYGFTPSNCSTIWAMAALDHQEEAFQRRMETLKKRRELVCGELKKLDWQVRSSRLIPYVWTKPYGRTGSVAFARRLYVKAGVKVAPGSDFGEGGEGWLRISLCLNESTLSEALKRLSEHSKIWQRKFRPEE
jgi:aspartate/methionine/tyrosine aminotransferase